MSRKAEVNFDYKRAVLLLKDRINNVYDLQRIWAFCGPCKEDCPEIEKIRKTS
jgi:hypothetical protein